jgi:hypothetical protein
MAEAMTEQRELWPDASPHLETVEERLQRLEQAVALLVERATANGPPPEGLATGTGELVPAGAAGTLAPVGLSEPLPGAAGFWGGYAVWREVRLMFRMYFDPRYRLSRICQLGAPAILILMVLNYFFIGAFPYIGFLLERLTLIVLAVALYKLLSWEAARYDAVLRYLTRYGR